MSCCSKEELEYLMNYLDRNWNSCPFFNATQGKGPDVPTQLNCLDIKEVLESTNLPNTRLYIWADSKFKPLLKKICGFDDDMLNFKDSHLIFYSTKIPEVNFKEEASANGENVYYIYVITNESVPALTQIRFTIGE
jgi:hypothetical protein